MSDAAMQKLVEAGFDPVYGARPLKRAIQSEVENPLAQQILSGEFPPQTSIVADVEDGVIAFHAATR